MSNLPLELIHIIVEQVANDRPTLYSLCLTSKRLNREATRFLYSRMVDDSSMVHYMFIQAIQKNPKLAVFVRVYHVPVLSPHTVQARKPQGWHIWTDIRNSLKLMVNLKELAVPKILWPNTSDQVPPIFDEGDQPSFQLERFVCWAHTSSSTFRLPEGMERFVRSQCRLKYLWWSADLELDLANLSIPDSLKCIHGSSDTVSQLLRIKPSVREVRWCTIDITWRSERRSRLKLLELEAFRNVRVLSIISRLVSQEGAIMRDIRNCGVGKFKELEVLIIQDLHSLKDPDILRSFPKLSEIIVSTPCQLWLESPPKVSPEDEKAIIESLFTMHGNIVEVDVCVKVGDTYRRWVKGELLNGNYILSNEKLLAYTD